MSSVQVTIKGSKNTIRFLDDVENKIRNTNIPKGITKATLFLHGEVKESIAGRKAEPTSVDTGRFLNSVGASFSKNNGVVFTNIPYAKFLEFGSSRLRARRHFSNSGKRSKEKIKKILAREIDNT